MWLNMVPGKPHRDIDGVVSVPVELRYESIKFSVFVRLDETGAGKSYVEAPAGVTLDGSLQDTLIQDCAQWVPRQEIEDRRDKAP